MPKTYTLFSIGCFSLCSLARAQQPSREVHGGVVGGIVRPPVTQNSAGHTSENPTISFSPNELKGLRHPYQWQHGMEKLVLIFPSGVNHLGFQVRMSVNPEGFPTSAKCLSGHGGGDSWAKWAEAYSMQLRFRPRKSGGTPNWAWVVVSIQANLREDSLGDTIVGFINVPKPELLQTETDQLPPK